VRYRTHAFPCDTAPDRREAVFHIWSWRIERGCYVTQRNPKSANKKTQRTAKTKRKDPHRRGEGPFSGSEGRTDGAPGTGVFRQKQAPMYDGWSLNGVEILDILVWDVLSDGECLTTQPRILTAAKCATRVAEEMGVVLGGKVGVKTRTVALVSANTHLGFVTDGILLRTIVSDRALSKYGCVIIDEAHERGINVDLILVLLKKTLTLRKDLKVGGGTRCGCPGGSQADTRRRS
jgi:hypothetical protein